MKTLLRIAATGMVALASCWAEETPAPPPAASHGQPWSLVYLPDLVWTEAEVAETLALLGQLKPDLVISMAPCPFAEAILKLDCKPTVLDGTHRGKLGAACGLPPISSSVYKDTSTLHTIGHGVGGTAALVWLSSEKGEKLFTGPQADAGELQALAGMQVRKHLAERRGEVVFLVDPSVPTPAEETWRLPAKVAYYEQAPTGVTGFACIRPGALQAEVAAIDGIAPRVPLIHWIRSGPDAMDWETLPADGGPAIRRSELSHLAYPGLALANTVGRVKAPSAPLEVPLWMDDYINNNLALDCGENVARGHMKRRFHWTDYGVTRDNFQVLRAGDEPGPEKRPGTTFLPHGAVCSPGNLFSITVGQLGEKGFYPEDCDDGVNVYLNDLRKDKGYLLYFACLSCAWPSTATWFTDRYVITSGTASNSMDESGWTDEGPHFSPLTLHLFDLQTGRSFVTSGIRRPADQARPNAPTERIYFPEGLSYRSGRNWRTLWQAIEDGYHAKPEPPPFTAEEVAALAKLPHESGLRWKDLGIWPPPGTWRLASDKEEPNADYLSPKPVAGGDPFLTYTETADGLRHYKIAIASYEGQTQFIDQDVPNEIVARADLITTGAGSLPKIGTIQRLGDDKRYLTLGGTYRKPGGKAPEESK